MRYLLLMLCFNLNYFKSPIAELSIYQDLTKEKEEREKKSFPVVRLAEVLGLDIFCISTISFMSAFHWAIITTTESWMFSSVIKTIENSGVIAHNYHSLISREQLFG